MSKANAKLLASFERLEAAEDRARALLRGRIETLQVDQPWIDAITEKSTALEEFIAAARSYCTEKKLARAARLPAPTPS
ncbi:hypothetical protein GCM10019059_35540 [Camelimonas fluminis]|uniref:Uncharacterized protein n=1 Tax=Camelimonas fluminis TaxID=1576911 RepID=A0ABV7UFL7_9HYPH|nr:hypothetical protein [Camelimonas fluminis]GHE72847.1 hypothetical protein GCM10019059_35540 [Camelimonas fluminis]